MLLRPALLDRLDGILDRPLTLVTAPAGYGKTTLVAQWCAERCPVPSSWWTVDDAADLHAVVDCLPTDEPHVVVVDDLGGDGAAHHVAAVVETTLPAKVRLVVLTRRPLGPDLASLRLDGRLDVLQERDLRLDPDELAALVELHTGRAPLPPLARAVNDELGGWMAGAILLALEWDARTTTEDHRVRLDAGYRSIRTILAATVADAIGPELTADLRAVACLPELHPELIDAVTGRRTGQQLVDAVQQAGVFTTPSELEPGGLCLRPLARDALRDARPGLTVEETATLQAAAAWCVDHHHSLLGGVCLVELGDHEAALDLVQGHLFDLFASDRVLEIGRFLAMIPDPVLRRHFSWMMNLAYMALEAGDTGTMLAVLAVAQRDATPTQLIVSRAVGTLSIGQLEDPTPIIEAAEAGLALCDEVGDGDVDYADIFTVSRTAHWRDYLRCGALVGSTYLGDWDRAARHDVEIDARTAIEVPAAPLVNHRGRRVTYLALSGQLDRAEREARVALAFVPANDRQTDRLAMAVWLGLGECSRNRFDVDAATAELDEGLLRARASGTPNVMALGLALQARLQLDLGEPEEARRLVAEQSATGHRPPRAIVGLLAAAEGRALHLTGAVGRARQVLEDAPFTSPVATAMVLAALERADVAEVERLVREWPSETTVSSRVHHDLAAAALGELRGSRRTARLDLRRALDEAARNGLLLPVRDFGVHVLHLLRTEANDGRGDGGAVVALAGRIADQLDRAAATSIRLTPRETLVLHHLADGITLPELADKLLVSKNTIKSQLRSVYKKLGVSSRGEAVRVWRASPDGPQG